MKTKFRFFALFLCLALILLPILTACQTTSDDPKDTTNTDTGNNTPSLPQMLFENKQMLYSFVYPKNCSNELKSAVTSCFNQLRSRISNEPAMGADKDIPVTELEILFGETDRPESQQVKAELTGETYCIKFVGKKLVVYATRDWMYGDAITALLNELTYIRNESDEIVSGTLPQDLSLLFDFANNLNYSRSGWTLYDFPAYLYGTLSEKVYYETVGYNSLEPNKKNYQMNCATNTTLEEFEAYADQLKHLGYKVSSTVEGNIVGYWVKNDDDRMYMYYTEATKDVRFILDRGDASDAEDFFYEYEKQEGDTTVFYLYGLAMDPDGINIDETYPAASNTSFYGAFPELKSKAGTLSRDYKNCGSMLVIKFADNSVMIVDGGSYHQMSVEEGEHLDKFLHNITNTPTNEKVRINCWYITHPHGDHYSGFARFLVNYHEEYELERIMYNFDKAEADKDLKLDIFLGDKYLKKYYPDIMYYRPHTGETIQLADVTFDVLFTHEDLVNPQTMKCEYSDGNSTSIFLRTTIDEQTVAILGDFAEEAAAVLLQNYRASELKMNIMQVPHHGWNNIPSLFDAIDPDISIFNQSSGGAVKGLAGRAKKTYENVVKATLGGAANLYFGGDETVGFTVIKGKFQMTFREDVAGKAWDGSDGGRESYWDYFDLFKS